MDRRGTTVYSDADNLLACMILFGMGFAMLIVLIAFFWKYNVIFIILPAFIIIILCGFLIAYFVIMRNYVFKIMMYDKHGEVKNLYGKIMRIFEKDEIKKIEIEKIKINVPKGSYCQKCIVIFFTYSEVEIKEISYENMRKDVTDYVVVPYSKKRERLIRSYVGKIE